MPFDRNVLNMIILDGHYEDTAIVTALIYKLYEHRQISPSRILQIAKKSLVRNGSYFVRTAKTDDHVPARNK